MIRYAPASTNELAVHAKKINDVRLWMKEALPAFQQYGRGAAQKMLILTG